MTTLYKTYEVGSLAKPRWRVKGYAGRKLSEADVEEAKSWAERLGMDAEAFTARLLGGTGSQRFKELSTEMVLKLFESAGLDYVYSGEQWRVEMYEHVARGSRGFRDEGWVKSFDYRYFRKASVVDEVEREVSIYLGEYEFIRRATGKPLKVPITGPYTMVDWSFNEHYERRHSDVTDLRRRSYLARRDLILDVVDNILRPEVEDMISAGADWIQVDEPALTTKPDPEEMELFVEAYNRLTAGLDAYFSLHNCFSDYDLLSDYVPELRNCRQLSLEYANRDTRNTGTAHYGYDGLAAFQEKGYRGDYAPGFVDVHTDFLESPQLVKERIKYVSEIVGADKVWVSPDCGLRTRSWDIAYTKLRNMVEGARQARSEA